MFRFIIQPAFDRRGNRLHGRFVASLDGRRPCVSHQPPLLDCARILLAGGADPKTPIAIRHAGAGFDALTSTVGTAAALTVVEGEGRPRLVRWKAFCRGAVQSPARSDRDRVPAQPPQDGLSIKTGEPS